MKATTLIQIVFILGLLAAAALAISSLPEIRRYLKMKAM